MKPSIFAVLLLAALTIACQDQIEKEPEEKVLLSPTAFQAKFTHTKGRLLDVRTPEEFQSGAIEGAVNINFYDDDFQDQIKGLAKDETYYVYCRSGGRSGKTHAMMREAGFSSVFDLDGGITAWQAQGLPVKTSEQP